MGLFIIAGCSDDDDALPDDDTPGKVTDIDGNVYGTVIIGSQEWMAGNLRVTRYNSGDAIPTDLSDSDWTITTEGAYAMYDHNHPGAEGIDSSAEMVDAYGKLYNWFAIDDPRGLCPEGWRAPSDDEWTELLTYIESQGFPNSNVTDGAGNALKSCRQVGSPIGGDCDTSEHPRWDFHNTHYGFNEFSFSALPGGSRYSNGVFLDLGRRGNWWSFTEYSGTNAWYRYMLRYSGTAYQHGTNKGHGFSVRCLRDNLRTEDD